MAHFWCRFPTHAAGCICTDNETKARLIAKAKTGEEPVSIQTLPYPANPRIFWSDRKGQRVPSFCFDPDNCAGKSACPKEFVCDD